MRARREPLRPHPPAHGKLFASEQTPVHQGFKLEKGKLQELFDVA